MPALQKKIDLLEIEQNPEDQELFAAVLKKLNNDSIGFFISNLQPHNILITDKVSGKKQAYDITLSHPLARHRKANSFLDSPICNQNQVHPNYVRYDMDAGEELGEGGFADVKKLSKYFYLYDGNLVIKTKVHAGKAQLANKNNPIKQIKLEAKATMAALHLRAKQPIFDANTNRTLIIMRQIEGITLQELLEQHERYPLTVEQRYRLTLNCLFAMLEQLEAYDLMHCDLKPENIMVNPITLEVTFIDFGFADFNSKPAYDEIRGTFDYMAPEILDGGLSTRRSDLFAMGMVIANLWCDGINLSPTDEIPNIKKFKEEMLDRALYHETLFTTPEITGLSDRDRSYIKNGILSLTKPDPKKRFQVTEVIENFITVYADHQSYTKKLTTEQSTLMKKAIDLAAHIRLNMQNLLLTKQEGDHRELTALLETQLPDQDFAIDEFFKILGSQVLQTCQNKASLIKKVNDEFELTRSHTKQLNATITRINQESKLFQHFDFLRDIAQHLFELSTLAGEATDLRTKLKNAYHFDRRVELNTKYQEKIDKLNDRMTQFTLHSNSTVAFFIKHRDTILSLQQVLKSEEPRDRFIFMVKQEILKYMQRSLNKESIIKSSRAASPARLKTIKSIIEILDSDLDYDIEFMISAINRHVGIKSNNIRARDLNDHVHTAIQQFEQRSERRRLSM